MTTSPFILDVDTGIDDALALALATRSPEMEILAVTTLAGNVDVAKTTENTRRVLSWLGVRDIPVHRGASRPLAKTLHDGTYYHDEDGLGNTQLPESSNPVGRDRGPAAIIRMVNERPGEITLVCVGALTNLAIALNVEPSLPERLKRLVIMGGAFVAGGNVTPHAEFNIHVDPEAAEQVFANVFPEVDVVGLDATHQTHWTHDEWERAGSRSSAAAQLAHRIYRSSFTKHGKRSGYLHDPLAVAIAMDRSLAAYERGAVQVTLDGVERGRTRLAAGEPSVNVAMTVDVERFSRLFRQRLDLLP
ncbi:MAG: nucleoside hydrolase [Thermomicrobiales bacterium]|nr:nucleoside hydrolase [Thermomicrobiales bacterium]